ncbi:MAG: hypothetical protein ACRC35_12295 [Angustibacter sp.]
MIDLGDDSADLPFLVEREVGRIERRLRGLPIDRLQSPDADGSSPAQRAHATAQTLADLTAEATGQARRRVPALRPHATADQLVVTARTLLDDGDPDGWVRGVEALVELRRAL